MIIKVTRKYVTGKSKGKITSNNYNMDDWEFAIKWANQLSINSSIPFVVIEMHNNYGQRETFTY